MFPETKYICEVWEYPRKWISCYFGTNWPYVFTDHCYVSIRIFAHQFSWPFIFTYTVYPKKYAHGFCFAVLCCGYTLNDFPISIRLTSLALWQSNDCPSASKATLMNMDKYFMWIHYERLYNHNKAKHNKTVCIILGIYCSLGATFKTITNFPHPSRPLCPLGNIIQWKLGCLIQNYF